MKLLLKQVVISGILATLSVMPLAAQAESNSVNGTTPLSADARLNLRVTIPRFLYFRVGAVGTGAINEIAFTPAAGTLGDSNPVSGLGGDAGGGSGANVTVRSNAGTITIVEGNDAGVGGLGSGVGNISLTEISATSSSDDLKTPELSDGGGNTESPTLNGGAVTNRSAVWTYSYDNTTTPEAGDYTAEITYTASSL